MNTQKGMRLHIGFFGKTNAGKSTLVNKISGQNFSIVSDIKGTTTDVNSKSMELLPVGPVQLLDTAGIDDSSVLGQKRIEKTKNALLRCDIAVFVCDNEPLSDIEKNFLKEIKIPVITVINKFDLGDLNSSDIEFLKMSTKKIIQTSAIEENNFISEFKQTVLNVLPDDYLNRQFILSDLVKENETCIFVIPIDKEAPKGRLILPQVNSLREMLDNNSISIIANENTLNKALSNLKELPKLVVTDSQAFKKVSEIVPDAIPLTSFSILFARLKGDLKVFYEGSNKLDSIKDNDKILILESCTHHPVEDDIGRVKIPALIKKYTNKNLIFEHYSGHDFPSDIEKYSLIIHCGACMTNRREILSRIEIANSKNIPITNYGIVIAKCLNILDRAIKPVLKSV